MKYTQLAIAIAAANLMAPTVIADQQTSPTIEEIMVYGEKQEKSLQELSASIGLITEEQLRNSTIQNFNDVYARIANVASLRDGNESLFSIRGVSVQGLTANAESFTAAVYVDDVALDNLSIRYGTMGLWDTQQIEVFRGPQGTLQGRSALNGAIIIKTNDPTYEWGGKAQVYMGENGTQRFSVAGGGALIEDQLAVRVSVDDYQSDGFVKNITLNDDKYSGFDRRSYRAKVLFEPEALEQFSALLTLSSTKNDVGDNPNTRLDAPFSFQAQSNEKAFHNIENDNVSLKMSWEFSDQLSLTSVTSYVEDVYDRFDDYDSSAAPLGTLAQDGNSRGYSQELRLNFEGGSLSGVAGIYYAENRRITKWDLASSLPKSQLQGTAIAAIMATAGVDQGTAATIFGYVPNLLAISQDYNARYETENMAIFGEATWVASEHWSFTLGARYDREDQIRNQTTISATSTRLPAVHPAAGIVNPLLANLGALLSSREATSTDYTAFLPKFVAKYSWNSDVNTAFMIQRGYRSGGSSSSNVTGQIHAYDPEYTWTYELANRAQLLDNRLTINGNIFYTAWQDQQVDVSHSGDPRDTVIGNAGKSTLYGAELEANWLANENLDVFGNIGYVKTEYKDFQLRSGSGFIDYSGNEFPGAPNLTAVAGFNYKHSNGFFVNADVNYQDSGYVNANHANDNPTDSRTLLNAKVGYQGEQFGVYLWGTNLSDKKYIATAFRQDPNVPAVMDYATPGAPRAFGLSLNVDF